MADSASKALKAYEEQYNKKPKDAAALVAFVKKNKELKSITQEQASAVLSATGTENVSKKTEKEKPSKTEKAEKSEKSEKTEKGDKTKGKGKEKEKEKEENEEKDDEAEKPEEKPKDEKPETPLYAIGDEVLMSKDRIGTVRYVGDLPELGNGLWYGVELIDGSIGQSDGSVRGKRYFTTEGKRALFVQSTKIRRKMTSRDYKKHDSMRLVQERKRESSVQNDNPTSPTLNEAKESSPPTNGATTYEKPQPSAEAKSPVTDHSTKESASEPYVPAASPSNGSHHRRRSSTLMANSVGVSAAEAYETLLTFILRQSDDLREQLLDVYANPELSPILVNSYAELKHMEKNEQERVWNALLIRWKRFAK